MAGYSEAIAYGAATIVNAIATGKGAAFGINLWTSAKVQLTNRPSIITGKIIGEPREDTVLIKKSVKKILKHFNALDRYGATVETQSNIPIAKGLKSSSVAANAIILATAAALGRELPDLTAVNMSVDASIEAKTTITGAYDDVCASYFGNIVITDNTIRRILKKGRIPDDYRVLIHIPKQKSYTVKSNVNAMRLMCPQVKVAFKEALKGNYWTALTLNGLVYSAALGYNPKLSIDALNAGAIAAGLTGKGPAAIAVARENVLERIANAWRSSSGQIVKVGINRKKAHILRKG